MTAADSDYVFKKNPLADKEASYGADEAAILNDAAFEAARETIRSWPGYAMTPLVSLSGVAKKAGVGALYYKDEAARFGLGSFKALGGAYAVWRVLCRKAEEEGKSPSDREAFSSLAQSVTVCCATDGNHGRSVAWGARTFGCNCVIFIHATVSEGRKREIEKYGARVVRCDGNYDDSVREAQESADREGWIVVSDTSYEGYMEIPKDVMQGYELMAAEALEQLPDSEPPTHVFLQTGVGGMAAAVTANYWRRLGEKRPTIVLADPVKSACWLETIDAGKPTAVEGDLDTLMAGLACGEVSELAWTILKHSADAVVALSDDTAVDGMKLLAEGRYGDAPLVAGESAVAGLMALLLVSEDPEARRALGLDGSSRVLVFGTEGATDPALYEELVGKTAADVVGKAA
ncbi:diaminopropionate ammonia-lyase [Roseibium aggregatum]|uniref:Diaminopropionate ammonia-lyase n=1 Tax=Roseibium aggregatum TaxID=187304 RepID=A0A939IYC1_9HYPH|nr:diaminopropionate ammonia-lyase [Roseibium aggregatum]MBN9668816.1 diaminopropionate ammonia-lyase [Roseibium aggregatum]